jgi:hypothetical protein
MAETILSLPCPLIHVECGGIDLYDHLCLILGGCRDLADTIDDLSGVNRHIPQAVSALLISSFPSRIFDPVPSSNVGVFLFREHLEAGDRDPPGLPSRGMVGEIE